MTRRARFFGLVTAVLTLSLTASAQTPEPGPDGVVHDAREVERLLAEASLTPVRVLIASSRLIQRVERNQPNREDAVPLRRLVFHVPAGAVVGVSTREGPSRNQSISFALWYPSLDPARPDEVSDQEELCRDNREARCAALANGRVARRVANGERTMLFEVSNATGTLEWRQWLLWSLAGHDISRHLNGPCELREDRALGMVVGRPPEGFRGWACGMVPAPMARPDNPARVPRQASFLKLEADGSRRFIVKCLDWVEDPGQPSTGNCRLHGFLGDWPIWISVPNNRANEWEATHERVLSFLTRHLAPESRPMIEGAR